MIRDGAPPFLLLSAIAWATSSHGGTSGRDLTLIGTLLCAAYLAARANGQRQQISRFLLVSFCLLEAWLIAVAAYKGGLDYDSIRVPALLVISLVTARTVHFLDRDQRSRLLQGLIVIGTLQATLAISEAVMQLSSTFGAAPSRADALIGNPNALGIFLVATGAITARQVGTQANVLLPSALVCQAVALLLTQSRLAIISALCVLVWFLVRLGTWRIGAIVTPWFILAVVIVGLRFAGSEQDRLNLIRAAIEEIARQPISGRGPAAIVFNVPEGHRPTTHAHNEALQLAVEYGLVGLALAVGVLVIALLVLPKHVSWDGWVVAAAASLAASGLTDFSLRITAITVTAAALAAAALLPSRGDRQQCSTAPTRSDSMSGHSP